MERVVKSFTGYSKEKLDKPATHIIMTVYEYEEMKRDLLYAQNEAREIKEKSKVEIEMYKLKTNKIVSDEKENAKKVVEAFQSEFNKAKNEINRLNDLNANILRINKEYANSKRGLKPKKAHSGYVVLDSEQYKYNFRHWASGRFLTKAYDCWKVRIQSPYNSSIKYTTISETIQSDLFKVFGYNLGIEYLTNVDDLSLGEFDEKYKENRNFIFKTWYRSNNKNGFWEVVYLIKNEINLSNEMVD
ncbi:hypothetical protein NNC19_23040 [Clostridium sp. SHJSY1]|uniref:hypothetical protein n=1 Tax=Clostridium sp. SHJSY1 TaxID=2942483 RepID=UPI002874BB53|nr:hypothetical protein [Clostridium sp. SHJSY1]MDS0528553.1 hypothetical protein [Clostridium sp. SHJSY1]